MAEPLSPTNRQRPRAAPRLLQSPTSPTFFLGSNNDDLERAQARAARNAAVRRKAAAVQSASAPGTPCLDKQQIMDLFHNCIKLASENKINQKNTWDLSLIDHLHDIIKVEDENDTETNFQKASCTLEAGVKIYSMRVDSVHSEAYKVLGGFNRVGQSDEYIADSETDANASSGQDEGISKKDQERKVSPLSTLELSFESLNVKKFDAAFAVDPLYHQTSAQFDEGGAKGLLLNNLGVYGCCRVLFDSFEVPGKSMTCANYEKSETIDLSFAKEQIEQMVVNVQKKDEISPTLKVIVNLFDENSRRPLNPFPSAQPSGEQIHEDHTSNEVELDESVFEDCGNWAFDHDDQSSMIGEETYDKDPSFASHQEGDEMMGSHEPEMDDRADNIDNYLFLSLGFKSKQNAWAGPDHWKYQKVKGVNETTTENGSPPKSKKSKNKKQTEVDIDFTKALDSDDTLDIFAPPKNPNSLLLPANRAPCNTTLPEDCHYQPEDLVKLFLLPNVMCLGRRGKKSSGRSEQQYDYGPSPSWEDDNMFGGQYDEGDAHSDVDDPNTLVSQPRQVNKIEVQYDKTSKQVDVQALKETLWDCLQESSQMSTQEEKERTSFKHVLANFPDECKAAPALNDISPHLCFICLLHLANEHGLSIHGCTDLDDLTICLPPSSNTSPTATN